MPDLESSEQSSEPKNESKEARFIRLGNARMAKILNDIRLLSNLIGPNYKSSRSQRDKIISRLRKAVEDLEYLFAGDSDKSGNKFSLEDPISDQDTDAKEA